MTLYLIGPLGRPGAPDGTVFDEAARALRACGYTIYSPAEHGLDEQHIRTLLGDSYLGLLGSQLRELLKADGVVLLDGWEQSFWAQLEFEVARGASRAIYAMDDLTGAKLRA